MKVKAVIESLVLTIRLEDGASRLRLSKFKNMTLFLLILTLGLLELIYSCVFLSSSNHPINKPAKVIALTAKCLK